MNEEVYVRRPMGPFGAVPGGVECGLSHTEVSGAEARLAMALLERWGMVAARPDGEDSAGRAKLTLLTPRELATRAVETAAEAFGLFRMNSWMVMLPTMAEAEAELIAREKSAKEASK